MTKPDQTHQIQGGPSKKKKSPVKTAVTLLISVGLIAFVVKETGLENITQSLASYNYYYTPFIALLIVANYVVSSFRWKQLLIHKNAEHITVNYLTKLYFMGSFFNNFMLTSVGGDVYKVYRLGKKLSNNSDAFAATFMERFTGVISLIFIAIFGFIAISLRYQNVFASSSTSSILPVLALSVGFIFLMVGAVFCGIAFLGKLKTKFTKLAGIHTSIMVYKGNFRVVSVALLTSFIVQLLAIFTQYFVFVSLGHTVDIFKSLFIFPIITLASFFIPSFSGIGVQDYLYKFSNGFLAITEPVAVSASILYHLFRFGVSLIGGYLYAVDKE